MGSLGSPYWLLNRAMSLEGILAPKKKKSLRWLTSIEVVFMLWEHGSRDRYPGEPNFLFLFFLNPSFLFVYCQLEEAPGRAIRSINDPLFLKLAPENLLLFMTPLL